MKHIKSLAGRMTAYLRSRRLRLRIDFEDSQRGWM